METGKEYSASEHSALKELTETSDYQKIELFSDRLCNLQNIINHLG